MVTLYLSVCCSVYTLLYTISIIFPCAYIARWLIIAITDDVSAAATQQFPLMWLMWVCFCCRSLWAWVLQQFHVVVSQGRRCKTATGSFVGYSFTNSTLTIHYHFAEHRLLVAKRAVHCRWHNLQTHTTSRHGKKKGCFSLCLGLIFVLNFIFRQDFLFPT